jgi:hypothetical protein
MAECAHRPLDQWFQVNPISGDRAGTTNDGVETYEGTAGYLRTGQAPAKPPESATSSSMGEMESFPTGTAATRCVGTIGGFGRCPPDAAFLAKMEPQ